MHWRWHSACRGTVGPEALDYFKRVQLKDFDDAAREWQARAALWAGDWKLVGNIIAAMPDQQRSLARWRYWTARAAEKTGDPKLARQLYESVLLDDNFYSIMAGARLDRPVAPHPEKLVLDQAQIERMEQLPPMVRARELLMSDLRNQAGSEWAFGFEQLMDSARTQAIHLAARWGWYDQAIATASQQKVFNDYELLYPQPYDAEVLSAAKMTGLSPQLIYSVMRQESLYRRDAHSSAGARGLLQMLPETARRTASKWNKPRPSPDDLFNPVINVPAGRRQSAWPGGSLRRSDHRGTGGLQRRPERGRALDAFGIARSRHLGRKHSVQRDPQLRAAHPVAQRGVLVAQDRRAAEGRWLAGADRTVERLGDARPRRRRDLID